MIKKRAKAREVDVKMEFYLESQRIGYDARLEKYSDEFNDLFHLNDYLKDCKRVFHFISKDRQSIFLTEAGKQEPYYSTEEEMMSERLYTWRELSSLEQNMWHGIMNGRIEVDTSWRKHV